MLIYHLVASEWGSGNLLVWDSGNESYSFHVFLLIGVFIAVKLGKTHAPSPYLILLCMDIDDCMMSELLSFLYEAGHSAMCGPMM